MRISDWSSDVCSSDLRTAVRLDVPHCRAGHPVGFVAPVRRCEYGELGLRVGWRGLCSAPRAVGRLYGGSSVRSEEHTSELQSLMRISYAVFCLKKKKQQQNNNEYPFLYQSQT